MLCLLLFAACNVQRGFVKPNDAVALRVKRLLLVDDSGREIGELVVFADRPGLHFVPIHQGKRDFSSFYMDAGGGKMVPDVGIQKKIAWPSHSFLQQHE